MQTIINIMRADAGVITVLSVAIILDIITGVIKAIISHNVTSAKFKTGLLKKSFDYILLVIAFCMDYLLGVNYVATGCLYALILMEFYSCLENLREYITIPDIITKALNILKDTSEVKE